MSKSVSFSQKTDEFVEEHDDASGHEDDELDPDATADRQFNKFQLLDLIDGADQADLSDGDDGRASPTSDSDDQDIQGKSKRKDKLATSEPVASGKRRSKKKRGKKGSRSKNRELEDLEKEVENLSKAIVLHKSAASRDENLRFKLLKVDTRHLIPESEIKRMFGKGVIKDDKSGRIRQRPGSNLQRSRFSSSLYLETKSQAGFAGPKMDLDELMNSKRKQDLQHTTGYDSAQHQQNTGESSSAIFNSDEPIYFKFVHDRSYQDAQREFLIAVDNGNPEHIVQNITIAPLHAESLVQLSHMVRVSEDYKSASDLIERALLVFERGFHPRFNIATANCRLTYKRPENRTFFITIFKHITYCHRRGLRRTPFEYSKLLLSLEPENDPLQAIQLIDFFALRSEEYDFVIDFYQKWDRAQKLPNISYSTALAFFLKSRSAKSTKEENGKNLRLADEYLQKALLIFPNFIIPLLDACSGEPSDELRKCAYFDYSVYGTNYKLVPETVEVLMNLYVRRSYSLWKQKPVMTWLEKNVESMVNRFKSGELVDERRHTEHWAAFPRFTPKNLLRHIVLCDLENMKVPSSAASTTFLDIDPYPPADSIASYDPTRPSSESAQSSSQSQGGSLIGNLGGLFIRSLLPSFSLTDQQQQQHQHQPGAGSTADPTRPNHGTSRRGQHNRGRAGQASNNQGLQITMADYVIDDEPADIQGEDRDSMPSAIRDLASAVSDLLNLQSSSARPQDNTNPRNEDGNRDDTNADRGNERNP